MRPGFDLLIFTNWLIAIFHVKWGRFYLFCFVCTHFVIKHHIGIDLDASLLGSFDSFDVFGFGAVFSPHRAFLIELAEIEDVIHSIADIHATPCPFVRRW